MSAAQITLENQVRRLVVLVEAKVRGIRDGSWFGEGLPTPHLLRLAVDDLVLATAELEEATDRYLRLFGVLPTVPR